MPEGARQSRFATTRWSLIAAAGGEADPIARHAMSELCESYWPPVYAYLRRRSASADEAHDVTQAFFTRLLEKRDIATADAEKGRFRAYLLGCVKHFLRDHLAAARAEKRGGGRPLLSIDQKEAESRFSRVASSGDDPERNYLRLWGLTTLERALRTLRDEYQRAGRMEIFEALQPMLTRSQATTPFAQIAAELGSREGSVKVAAHRLRRRYGELLRAEVRDTLGEGEDPQAEIGALFDALSRPS